MPTLVSQENQVSNHQRPRAIPLLEWLPGYQSSWLRYDLIAGLITAAVVIPKAMAYATIAGLPVQVGLYTALVPMAIYVVLGTSRVLSVSTTTTIAILTGAELSLIAPDGDPATLIRITATLALLVGAMLLVAWVLRLGFVANFISEPVLVGFKAGIGLVIVLDQVPKLLIGVAAIALLVALEHFVPKVPAPLVVMALGIAAMRLLGLEARGVESVGLIPQGLPSLIKPDLSLLAQLWPGAAGIALMSFTETIAAARAFSAVGEPLLR